MTRETVVQGKPRRAFDDKHKALIRKAAEIFAAQGYEGTSIRDISRSSKIGLSNIYYYVSCKEELLFLIQNDTFSSLLETVKERIAGVDDPEERLRVIIRNHIAHFSTHMAELKVCARELTTLTGGYYEEVRRVRREYFGVVLDTVSALMDRHGSSLDPWLATANLFGMLNWFYQWYGLKADRVRPEELAEEQLELILWGIRGKEVTGAAASP